MKRIFAFLWVVAVLCGSCHKEETQISYGAQLLKDDGLIDQYLTSKNITAIKDSSGLRYVVAVLGTGVKPTITTKVGIRLSGKILSTGQVIPLDTLPIVDQLTNFTLKFIQIGVQLMPKGSSFTFYIPSGLAYGTDGSTTGDVPPNTNLIFDITLLDDDAQLKKDKASIDAYLAKNGIVATKDSSGLRYMIKIPGTGNSPTLNSNIIVTYTGTLISNGTSIGTGTDVEFRLSDQLAGWQIGLQKIKPQGEIILYIPSGLAFGPAGSSDGVIPENANVIYDVQLVDD